MSAEARARVRRAAHTCLPLLASAAFFAVLAVMDPALAARRATRAPLRAEDEHAILAVIETANAILQDFHASGGVPTLLNEMPYSTELRHQVFRDLGLLRDAGLLLILDAADLRPLQILRTGPDEAEALVFEEWNYLYQRAVDRKPVEPLRGMGLGIRYRLARRDDSWQIVAFEPEDVAAPGPTERATW